MNNSSYITIPNFDNGRKIHIKANGIDNYGSPNSSWANSLTFYNNEGTKFLAIGGFGGANNLSYMYLGTNYDNNAIRINTDNRIILTSQNYGPTVPSTGTKGQIFFVEAK